VATHAAATIVAVGRAGDTVTVAVPSGAVSEDATVTVTETGTPPGGSHATFAAGTHAVQVSVQTAGGAAVRQFAQPLDLTFPDAPAGIVPAYSPDGIDWTEIPRLANPPTLPSDWIDGWYRAGDGTLHILTRHATYFGLLTAKSTVAAALQLTYGLRRHLNLNYRHSLVLHVRPSFPAALTVTLKRQGKKLASWHARLSATARAITLTLPQNARRRGVATLVLSVSGAGESVTRSVPITIAAGWTKKA
jgi:hypothetical protein